MSAIRSASSTTTVRTAPRSMAPCATRSSRRPGTGHDDVDAPSQGLAGGSVSRPAVDGDHAPASLSGQQGELALHLGGQLAGGDEDQRSGAPRLRSAGPAHDGQPEGQGLARSGRGATTHVAPGERVGKRRLLDGERAGQAAGVQAGNQVGAHPEIGK